MCTSESFNAAHPAMSGNAKMAVRQNFTWIFSFWKYAVRPALSNSVHPALSNACFVLRRCHALIMIRNNLHGK
jgi:hypothetical protein